MTDPLSILPFLFSLLVLNCFGQQVQLNGLDVRTVIIDDTTTVHGYINQMNFESKNNHVKSKTASIQRKKGKSKIKSREDYNSEGKIIYKVDYGWNKGRDSATVHYDYDSIGRLVKAVQYNSIFGPDHEGRTIWIEYDSNNRVTQCKTEYDLIKFYYNSIGNKVRIELSRYYHHSFPSIKRPKTHVYDTTLRILYFNYDANNLLNKITNNSGHNVATYDYEQNGQLIKENQRNQFLSEHYYDGGQLVKSTTWEIQYPSLDSTLFESCEFIYIDNKLSNCNCKTQIDGIVRYSIQYRYNDKGLLIEKIKHNSKGVVYSRVNYNYDYY